MINNSNYLIGKLARALELTGCEFLVEHLKKEEFISDVINLVLSAYISSLFTMMKLNADGDQEAMHHVENFIAAITKTIGSLPNIESIEKI